MNPPVPNSTDNILSSIELAAFVKAARNYCVFIEAGNSRSSLEFLKRAQRHLLIVYCNITNLPSFDLAFDADSQLALYDIENDAPTSMIAERITSGYYWHNFDPTDEDNLLDVCSDLVDDLAVIYDDIKRALLQFDSDPIEIKLNAIWQFRFDFHYHWGDYCANSLYAAHYFIKKQNERQER